MGGRGRVDSVHRFSFRETTKPTKGHEAGTRTPSNNISTTEDAEGHRGKEGTQKWATAVAWTPSAVIVTRGQNRRDIRGNPNS